MKYDMQENWMIVGGVSEPEDGTDVLVVSDDDVEVAWYNDEEYIRPLTGDSIIATHWMPLPKLPIGE